VLLKYLLLILKLWELMRWKLVVLLLLLLCL
jgi:hypothetical protein